MNTRRPVVTWTRGRTRKTKSKLRSLFDRVCVNSLPLRNATLARKYYIYGNLCEHHLPEPSCFGLFTSPPAKPLFAVTRET
jgi:hypothetical protein